MLSKKFRDHTQLFLALALSSTLCSVSSIARAIPLSSKQSQQTMGDKYFYNSTTLSPVKNLFSEQKIKLSDRAILKEEMRKAMSLQIQISEAWLLSTEYRIELNSIYSTYGKFVASKLPKHTITGQYIDSSNVSVSESEKTVYISYHFGKNAAPELVGKEIQIVGETPPKGALINWYCQSNSTVIVENMPYSCLNYLE